MSIIARADPWLEREFDPIDLATLNARAEMLERLDNKYVVQRAVLRSAAAELARHFDILEIAGRRAFTYETCYFDNQDRRSYFDHHQGRRRRVKVRIRKYLDAGLCFVEVKLKDKRGATVKKRLGYAPEKFGGLDEAALAFVHRAYREQYGDRFPYRLQRVVDMRYVRM
ncbi:MAG: VTC domain-containing protein, partial [Parvibaculaceae bacterium]